MFNKATGVTRITGHSVKSGFYCRKRTQPSGQFDICPPTGGRNINQRNPAKAKREQPAKNDEADKQEMDNKNRVG